MLVIAALTSAISLTEPALAWLVEDYNAKRGRVAVTLGVIFWALGLGTVFSFNIWADVQIFFGKNFFDTVDFLANNTLLPLGGMLIAFVGWVLPKSTVVGQLGFDGGRYALWQVLSRFVAPAGVLVVFVYTVISTVQSVAALERSALLLFSAERMFALVNDVRRYPEFVPWCAGAEVLAETDALIEASSA